MIDERATWTDEKDAIWMTEMIYQVVVLGKCANSGFKKEAWQAALSNLNIEHRVNYTKVQLKARNAEIKEQYAQVSQMQHFLEGKPRRWALGETKRFPQNLRCQQLYDGCHGKVRIINNTTGKYGQLNRQW
ncbi:hypothetical protein H257_07166 [Aphanomyces astaci]|uniref:Myb/SANT-like domain-containing protein n=1 Tax=Aphanomyces astaci TaxID=112090 RepID=W4GJU6_APHAT|nr:hypothetical protein H257_07166 [Aphanomyces astaci]ETV79970.1 hypothetical protein H257_07166 [Aphanomyces astaci]|eukprot:XP_009830906.1 hypothetical protein H257_07166 [Aphanomyces astaci]